VSRVLLRVFLFAVGFVVLFVVVNVQPGFGTPLDLGKLIGMLIVFGPWLVGGYLGWLWGRTWLRVAGVVTMGLFLTGASLAAILFFLGSSGDTACGEDECLHYLGHWIESSFATKWPIYAVVAWALSAVVFSQHRLVRDNRVRGPERLREGGGGRG